MLLDVWLKKMDGLETLARIQARGRRADGGDDFRARKYRDGGARDKTGRIRFHREALSLGKDHSGGAQRAGITAAGRQKTSGCARNLDERHQILGGSVPMKALRQQIALTAPTNGRVLIYGESGTGKELVARALHAQQLARRSMPFVEVNCAAIPEELIESEMFGHRKGSFTGASEDKIGKFQKADGGTLVSRRSRRHEPEDAVESAARAGGAARGADGVESSRSTWTCA